MLLAWGPSVLIGILIFYVSHIPGNEITTPKSISNLKPSVIYHIIIFISQNHIYITTKKKMKKKNEIHAKTVHSINDAF